MYILNLVFINFKHSDETLIGFIKASCIDTKAHDMNRSIK
jgi:hypothetical protein